MKRKVLLVAALVFAGWARGQSETVEAECRGLRMVFDADTGGLIELSHPDVGVVLKASPETASLVDVAYPLPEFEPLRRATRFSEAARIEIDGERIAVTVDSLGCSRPGYGFGPVSATVEIEPAEDSRSLLMRCTIRNASEHDVRQVLFPDFAGLQPFAGIEGTEFRTAGFANRPFEELYVTQDTAGMYQIPGNWRSYMSGGYFGTMPMFARWMDLGSLEGGISLFPRLWSWDTLAEDGGPQTNRVFLHLSLADRTLRLMCEHKARIRPGETWHSPEYVLTPHEHGWAKGIEPFRAWVKEHVERPYPLPKHIRESIGFRTVWMAQQFSEGDPTDGSVVWKARDLPKLARECREHGLREMNLWGWNDHRILPDKPLAPLGSLEEFDAALQACRDLGVNPAVFVSLLTIYGDELAKRYGLTISREGGWTYHSELIPMFRAYYTTYLSGAGISQQNELWQSDVIESLTRLIDRGWSSIGWDQVGAVPKEPNVYTILSKVRTLAKARDPESTLSGESTNNIDIDSRWLDYTWDWYGYSPGMDFRGLVNAYPTTRWNVGVGTLPEAAKRLFVDHLFLNVMPSKPEGVNGSAYIADTPELSAALKVCAGLHEQFLPYLEDGVLVGDCVLEEPCRTARVNGYILPDRALLLAINTSGRKQAATFKCDMAPWLESGSGRYDVRAYNERGEETARRKGVQSVWSETTAELAPNEIVVFEVLPHAEDGT